MTIDIADFIDARITEDEAAAHAVGGENEHWHADGGSITRGHPTDQVVDYTTAAAHIARHDPARVLRESAALRATMEPHYPHPMKSGECVECGEYDHEEGWIGHPFPCLPLRRIASIWADHDDYQETWAL